MSLMSRSQILFTTVIGIVALITMALLPVNATGKEKDAPFGLTVMGKPVTEENKDNILGDDTKSMSYDPETRVLRLENLTLDDTRDNFATIASSDALTIEVIGKNTITAGGFAKGIVLEAKGLVFEGDGSLDVSGGAARGITTMMAEETGIEVNGPAITSEAGGAARGGSAAVWSAGPITVNSGALKGDSGPATGGSSGIFTRDTLTVNGGIVEAQGGSSDKFDGHPKIAITAGITALKGVVINGGEVTTQAATDPGDADYVLAFHVEEGTVDIAENLNVTVSKSADGSDPGEWDRSTPLHGKESPYQYAKVTGDNQAQPKPSVAPAEPSDIPAEPSVPAESTSTATTASTLSEADQ